MIIKYDIICHIFKHIYANIYFSDNELIRLRISVLQVEKINILAFFGSITYDT